MKEMLNKFSYRFLIIFLVSFFNASCQGIDVVNGEYTELRYFDEDNINY